MNKLKTTAQDHQKAGGIVDTTAPVETTGTRVSN